jgi:hypothetical protein
VNSHIMLMSLFLPCFVVRRLKYPVFRPPHAFQGQKIAYFIKRPFTGRATTQPYLPKQTPQRADLGIGDYGSKHLLSDVFDLPQSKKLVISH